MEAIGVLLQIGVMIALFASIAIAASRSRRQMREAWNHVASRLGLTLGYGSPTGSLLRLTGTMGHVYVRLYQERVQSGKNSTIRTYLELTTDPPIPSGVNVAVERMGHSVAKTLNIIDDVEVGHDEFDRRYLIDANDADALAWRLALYVLSHHYEGRLGAEAISNRGLVYYIGAKYRASPTAGLITLQTGVDQLAEVRATLELLRARYDGTRPFSTALPDLVAVHADEGSVDEDPDEDDLLDGTLVLRVLER